MFDRYSEDARRVLFFARYAIVERGGDAIEPEHIVLGILRASPHAIIRFVATDDAARVIEDTIIKTLSGPVLPGSHEIRFSTRTIHALERAQTEADDLGNRTIGPEHLLLGVLVKTSGTAAEVLTSVGVKIPAIRGFLQ